MNQNQFEALVDRLADEQSRNPGRYRRKVIALACAGYAYIVAVLLIAVFLLVASLLIATKAAWAGIKLAVVVGAFLWIVLKAMWVRLEPPQGRRITRAEAPDLFAMLDHLQRELHVGARFHQVLITDELNAAVVQTPRLGVFGWHKNTLIIGLPLMKALTRKQLAAVLAHEIGHLGGGHARLGNWIYRLRLGWSRLALMLEESRSLGGLLFKPFYGRFVPYFTAVSFPLARANEYEADANSARLTSPTAAAAALTTINVIGAYMDTRFWPSLFKHAHDHARPQFAPLSQLSVALSQPLDAIDARGWLDEALSRKTSVADTHPALADRLKALGQAPLLAPPAPGDGADQLLGSALPKITQELDAQWQERVAGPWAARHEEVKTMRERLAQLDRADQSQLSLDERIAQAYLTEEVGAGEAAALAAFRALLAANPDHPALNFAVGQRLLKIGDAAGAPLVERAMDLEDDAIASGAALLRDFYEKRGDEAQRKRWHQRWVDRLELLQAADAERGNVSLRDRFMPNELNDQQLDTLRSHLATLGLRGVWLVRKEVRHLVHRPHFVLAFTVTPWWRWRSEQRIAAAQQAIMASLALPGSCTVFCGEGDNVHIWRRVKKTPGSRLI